MVIIRDRDDSSAIASRVEGTRKLIGVDVPVFDVYADGVSPLARLMSGIYFGDFVSVYLAFLWDEDPSANRQFEDIHKEIGAHP